MPSRSHAATHGNRSRGTRRTKRASSRTPHAIALLMADHKTVDKLFKRFAKADDDEKAQIVQEACAALTVHATIEEEIFYPALREADVDSDLLDEAKVEHKSIKRLVSELESMQPGEELYDAKLTVLAEYVKHHVKEEEGEIFPKAKRADVDMDDLGNALEVRKTELEGRMRGDA